MAALLARVQIQVVGLTHHEVKRRRRNDGAVPAHQGGRPRAQGRRQRTAEFRRPHEHVRHAGRRSDVNTGTPWPTNDDM